MKIALAQLNPVIGDLPHNAQLILAAAEASAASGTRLLLTPELSLCGYPPRDLLFRPDFIQAMQEQLLKIAQRLPQGIAVLVGAPEPNPEAIIKGGKPLYNSMYHLESGEIKQTFRKHLLPTYNVFDENRYFEPAEDLSVLEIDGVSIGVSICEDLWNDEEYWGKRVYAKNPVADLVAQGVDLLINMSASPYNMNKRQIRETMFSHVAKRHQCALLVVNQVGSNDELIFDGDSMVFNAQGEMVARARGFQPDLMIVSWDVEQMQLKRIEPERTMHPTDTALEAELMAALTLGVSDYAEKCGFTKVVLGLSGGVDSALVAAIAAAALGPENVTGVLMPSPYSSEHSISDALALAKNLGINTHTLAIGDLMTGYDQLLSPLFEGLASDTTEENLQSRIRGNLLMAIANKFGYLLLSTGNKSEMSVGYCTLYGDMNGGLSVISDVPKMMVYSLCNWLNGSENVLSKAAQEVIPEHIITKPPSAELKPDQTDQDSLPDYEILDDILYRYVEEHQSKSQLEQAGHDPETIDRVIKLVSQAEFKRRQAPPGLRVTGQAYGMGWRMPIAARRVN